MLLVALMYKLSQLMFVLFVALRNKSELLETYPTFDMSQLIISSDWVDGYCDHDEAFAGDPAGPVSPIGPV